MIIPIYLVMVLSTYLADRQIRKMWSKDGPGDGKNRFEAGGILII